MNKAICGAIGLVGLLSVGCVGNPDVVGGGEGGSVRRNVDGTENATDVPGANKPPGAPAVDANTRYVPEQDATKAQAIATRMWATLTAAPCWHMQGSSDNYTFSGVNDYRHAGYETTAGQIRVSSVGTFGGYDMADVVISRTQYWIAIYDAKTITLSFFHDNGKLVTNWFIAAEPGQYCV